MTSEERKARLIELLRQLSVRTGTFQLASGGTTDLYLDVRQTTLHAEGAEHVAHLVLERLHPDAVAIGGPTLGADPIACSAAAYSRAVLGRDVHGFLVRKEAKGHGTGNLIEGMASLRPGSAVCVVEDTTTTGGSLLGAIERIRESGLKVVQCLVVVERGEGAADRFRNAGLVLEALVTRSELVP